MSALSRVGDWQPISTAPKDRTRIILCITENVGRAVCEGYYGFNGRFRAWFKSETGLPVKPVLWQPLPNPPAPPMHLADAMKQSGIERGDERGRVILRAGVDYPNPADNVVSIRHGDSIPAEDE